ncbi:MAG TPA: M20/M25/M40 family metallo-hydrolase [Candidatus Hydrogenedentes bacterium]|nr:M20/M25/M40 family metallo-hydrolase [Candidatus Hydrogenedentota bacterium]HNT86618.1 M20/M25/M40 family metallo-hydrolase [Candidatus Hydrogenedentota bacterium]
MSDPVSTTPWRAHSWTISVLGVLVLAAGVSLYALAPPRPLPEDGLETEFSAHRALRHNSVIAKEPHPAGSPANEKVQTYIFETLQSFGVEAEAVSEFVVGRRGAGQRNMILGRIPGTANTKAFALMAHYDSVPYGPGAADDGAGVSAMLEVARALKASPPLQNDVILVFTDGEEDGLLGAHLFADHPQFGEVGVTANLEARGTRGTALLFGTSPENGWLIAEAIKGVRYPCTSSLMYDVYRRMPFSSDFDALRRHGMKGFDIAFIDNFAWYHTKNDKPEHLDLGSLQHVGMYALDMARHFGDMPLDGPVTAPDVMYFNTIGYNMVRYPLSWGGPLALLTALLVVLTLLIARLRGHVSVPGVLAGVFLWALSAVLAAGAALIMLAIIWGPDTVWILYTETITRIPNLQPLHHNNLYVASITLAAIAVAALVYGAASRWVAVQSLALGACLWWTAAMLVVARVLPGAGYLVMWPLFFATLGLLIHALLAKPGLLQPGWAMALTVSVLPAVVLFIPAYRMGGYTVMIMAAPGLALLVTLLMGLLVPQLVFLQRRNRWWLPSASAALAALLVGISLANSDFTRERPKLNSVSYGIDYDVQRAFWLSADSEPDEWTVQFFPPGTPRDHFDEFVPGSHHAIMKAPAPIAPQFPGPEIAVVGDEISEDTRQLVLHVASPAGAAQLELRMVSDTEVQEALVFGRPLDMDHHRFRVNFRLFPKDGIDLTLRVPAGGPVRLNARETFYGLPQLPGYQPRPEYMACMPNTVLHGARVLDSEHVYVTRTFDF